jgi:hypothetical protein
MPLLSGKANIGKNIATEESHGKPKKQAIAIALNVARKGGASIPKKKHSKAEVHKMAMEELKKKAKEA